MTYVGQPIKRREDHRFLTGKGKYTDDIVLPDMTYAAFVRSPYAHANIKSINASAAESHDGVVAVFTGEHCGQFSVPCGWQVDFKNGDQMKEPPHPLLAVGKARYAGENVAVVIADSLQTARDAVELVEVDYEELPSVTDAKEAIQSGAPQLHDDVPSNLIYDWEIGNPKEEVDAALDSAHHVTKLDFNNQRLIPNAIEPRSYIASYSATEDKWTLYTSTQNPHVIRLLMCAFALGIPEHKVRVVSYDVGGGFGSKIYHYTEEALVTWASKEIGRPIKWTADRSEAFATDAHGRDNVTTAQMGFDADGKIVALKIHNDANLGAYLSTFSTCVPTYLHGTLAQGCYTTPLINVDVNGVLTNTTPVDAYRGAGRPEMTYILEHLLDTAALEMGKDPADLRFKNFIPPFDGVNQPGYQTQVALQYDSGNYEATLKRALEMVGYEDFRKDQEASRNNGKLLGIGFSTYIEACGIAPSAVVGSLGARAGLYEVGHVRVQPTERYRCLPVPTHMDRVMKRLLPNLWLISWEYPWKMLISFMAIRSMSHLAWEPTVLEVSLLVVLPSLRVSTR